MATTTLPRQPDVSEAEAHPRQKAPLPKVALLVETSNAYARGLLEGIEAYLRVHGPWNVCLTERGRGEYGDDWLDRWNGDGVLARVENRQIANALGRVRIPVVDLSAYRLLPSAPVVTTDNAQIAQLAFDHFRERGFRHYAFCGDDRFAWSIARAGHFDELVRGAGFWCDHYSPPHVNAGRGDATTDSIANWLTILPLPVAVFACYDARGQQVLDACQRAGLSVPDQVAVLGVDNDQLLCALSPPPLSSIDPNASRIGWSAAELLAELMRRRSIPPSVHRVPPLGVATRKSSDTHAVADPQIARALRFIREHACDGIGVPDVLHHCPMSRRNFEVRMRALLGRSPHEEITRIQVQRAKELLVNTDLVLPEIAERCGFRHAEYLSVVFKRETGMPPSEYRRENTNPGSSPSPRDKAHL